MGLSGKVHQRRGNVGLGPMRDGSWMFESLGGPLVEAQLVVWVEPLGEVGRNWRGRKRWREEVLGAEHDVQNSGKRRWCPGIGHLGI